MKDSIKDKMKGREGIYYQCASDHRYLTNLCEKYGFSEQEIHGDSWGVPGIQELADLLDRRIQELTPRPLSEILKDDETIEDGFGSEWSKTCAMCGEKTMYIVRPGEAQCANCD